MNGVQQKALGLLECFVDICEKLDIPYFLVCGTALGAVKSLKDDALNMIPGFSAAKGFKEKFIDPKLDKGRQAKIKADEEIIEKGLIALGVDQNIAKAAAKAVGAAEKAKKKAKDDNKKRMEQYKKEFQGLM